MRTLHRSASFVSQQIMQTHISDRQVLHAPKSVDAPGFRSTVNTPLMLGTSQCCDDRRIQKLEEILSKYEVGISYKESNKQCVIQIAEGVQNNLEEADGNYVRSGLYRRNRLRFSVDNIDGKNLFHLTAISVYQRQPMMNGRAYLTEAQHLDSYLPLLSMAWLLCMNWVFTKVTLMSRPFSILYS